MSVRRSNFYWALLLISLAAWGFLAPAQSPTKRLVLKDGSYQLATKWEVHGERLRYFSAERNEWEEIPNDMVDWEATNRYESDRAAGKMSPAAQALDREAEAERQAEELRAPQVAPGLRLPPEGGVYALDTYLSEPELLPLDQTGGEVNRHVAHNVLRAAINPVAGAKHTIELPGPSSKLQVHAALPAFYINLEPDVETEESSNKSTPGLPWDRFRLIRLEVKGDKRIAGAIKMAVYGKVSHEEEGITADAVQLGGGWVKLTPKTSLAPGEYAIAELLGKQGINSYVWDFGVHPEAPANLAVIKPDPRELKKASDERENTAHPK